MQNLITNQLNYTQLRPLVRSKNKHNKKYTQAKAGYVSTFPERRVERERAFLFCLLGVISEIRLVSDGRGNWRFEKMQKRSEQRCDSKSRRR